MANLIATHKTPPPWDYSSQVSHGTVKTQLDRLLDEAVIPGHRLHFVTGSGPMRDEILNYLAEQLLPESVNRARGTIHYPNVVVHILLAESAASVLRGTKGKAFIDFRLSEYFSKGNAYPQQIEEFRRVVEICQIMNDREKQEQENYAG